MIEGTDLAAWSRIHGAMPADVAVTILSQLAQALDAAPSSGSENHDVTPSNIMLTGGQGMAIDASTVSAHLLEHGSTHPAGPAGEWPPDRAASGTSQSFASPERLTGTGGDPRSDVYSLGCVLYQMLTGRPPFDEGPAEPPRHGPPKPGATHPEVPEGLDEVVARAMAQDPAQRYASAGELASSARAALAGSGAAPVTIVRAPAPPAASDTIVRPASTPAAANVTAVRPASTPAAANVTAVRPASTPAASDTDNRGDAGTLVRPPGSTADADGTGVRFGPGPPAPGSPAPSAPGWGAATPPEQARRNRGRAIGASALITALAAAAGVAYLAQRPSGQLQVTAAAVAPAADPGRSCDTTVDVVGTVRTNGRSGQITYRWLRSDGGDTDTLTQTVEEGSAGIDVHLQWKVAGKGRYPATATLQVVQPNPIEARGGFIYDCR